jgi:AcrR family transcriptional regulator
LDNAKMNNVQEESLREQKKGRRRLLILEIARGLIAAKGLRSLKVRDVAEAADCSIGSVYNEFGDFDGLILTVNRETAGRSICGGSHPPASRARCDLSRFRHRARQPVALAVRTPDGGRPPLP